MPIIGKRFSELWSLASTNFAAALQSLAPLLKGAAAGLLAASAEVGIGVLQFFAIVVAGFLLANSGQGASLSRKLAIHFFGSKGAQFEALAEATIRSVTTGILGVALIQSLFAGLGFLVVQLPGAGLWALLFLVAAVLRIGALRLIPAVIYVFATMGTDGRRICTRSRTCRLSRHWRAASTFRFERLSDAGRDRPPRHNGLIPWSQHRSNR